MPGSSPRRLACIVLTLALIGCRGASPPMDIEHPMPPNTILLSQMLREQPGFSQTLLQNLNKEGKLGPALLTPSLIDELRKRILGADWRGLDRFPGWTMGQITPTVRVITHVAGAPANSTPTRYLDVDPYALNKPSTISLNQPSDFPAFTTQGILFPLGYGVTRGDGPSPLAPEHPESQRLANILNRLSINPLSGISKFQASLRLTTDKDSQPHKAIYAPLMGGSVEDTISIDTPAGLIAALQQTGHEVSVSDARYFANFAHLHYNGKDVMAPFWINTRIQVPGTHRPLLIPVAHAEYEWRIRGPLINADVSWYFGIDGKAEFRTMDTLDQPWVLKRDAHTYTGKDAVEVTRLVGLFTLAYMRQHIARPQLPFGGYYTLGVCQDSISAIERHMTGTTTLFPNTADTSLFNDPRDAEVNQLIAAIPRDGSAPPTPERIFGSLPLSPAADPDHAFDAVTIPGLAPDLNATYAAWQRGEVRHTHPLARIVIAAALGIALASLAVFLVRRKRPRVA